MKATPWEFRYRLWLSAAIVVLGFWSPWLAWERPGAPVMHTWGWLAIELSRVGLSSTFSFTLVTSLAIAAAAAGAALRVWGTAWLGAETVFHAEMKAGPAAGPDPAASPILAQGPFRYTRNPLYLGSYLTIVALTILMPPTGAAVCLLLLGLLMLRLILGEEAFLALRLGQPYAAYRHAVPRLVPNPFRKPLAAGPGPKSPRWTAALLGELFPIGVAVSLAALSWQYDAGLLSQAALVSFGVSLVVRAILVPGRNAVLPAS